jgi:hypothetical protein
MSIVWSRASRAALGRAPLWNDFLRLPLDRSDRHAPWRARVLRFCGSSFYSRSLLACGRVHRSRAGILGSFRRDWVRD